MSDILLQIVKMDPRTGNSHVHSWRIDQSFSDALLEAMIHAQGRPKCTNIPAVDARKIMDSVRNPG